MTISLDTTIGSIFKRRKRKTAGPNVKLTPTLNGKYRAFCKNSFSADEKRDAEAAKQSAAFRKGKILVPCRSEYEAPHYGAAGCFRYFKRKAIK